MGRKIIRTFFVVATITGATINLGAAVAGPTLYDVNIFFRGTDPVAEAFYRAAPGIVVKIPASVSARVPRQVPSFVPAKPFVAHVSAVPVEVGLSPSPSDAAARQGPSFALDRAYIAGNIGFVSAGKATNSGVGFKNKWNFESGIVVQAAYGYRWKDRATTEVEVANRLVDMKSQTHPELPGTTIKATGHVSVLSILANVTYEFPNRYRATPYALGGLGFAKYSAVNVRLVGLPIDTPIVNSKDWVIGYQLGGGLLLPITNRWVLDMSYRYFATTQPELKDSTAFSFKTDFSNHNFLMGLRYKL